jgi:hypothetical protein
LLHQKLELGPAIVWFSGTSVQCGAHSSLSILGCVVTPVVTVPSPDPKADSLSIASRS